MAVLDRIRAVLISLLALLVAALTAAVVLGVVLRPAPPLDYPVAEGRAIDHARNDHSQTGRWLHLPQHRVGVIVSCQGSGHIDVTIGTTAASTAATRTSCSSIPGGAAYVLSTFPEPPTGGACRAPRTRVGL